MPTITSPRPTEVKATLQAARSGWPEKRLVAVSSASFVLTHPAASRGIRHVSCFDADVLVVTDVYPSGGGGGESPLLKVSAVR